MTPTERRNMRRAERLGDRLRLRRRTAELELRACAPWHVEQKAKWSARFDTMSKRLALLDAIASGGK